MVHHGQDDSNLPVASLASEFYDRYEPREQLGSGVSSIVRRCVDRDDGEEYAVKIIDLTGGVGGGAENQDADILRYVENEVKLLSIVKGKPNCIRMKCYFQTEAYFFIVFELMPRGELFDYLTKEISLDEPCVRQIMIQIFRAIDVLHSHDIVHRDVKMENLLLDQDLHLKITDFGFAQHLKLSTSKKLFDLCGTVSYMSPEMLQSSIDQDSIATCDHKTNIVPTGYNHAIDLWACGVIMYTLLVGRAPFYHRREIVVLRKILNCDYNLNSSEWSKVSEPAKDLIAQCLTHNPAHRITAASALQHSFFTAYSTHSSSSISMSSLDDSLPQPLPPHRDLKVPSSPDSGMGRLKHLSGIDTTTQSSRLSDMSFASEDGIILEKPPPKLSKRELRQKFRTAIYVVRATIRWQRLGRHRAGENRPVCQEVRGISDQASYNIYKHWLHQQEAEQSHAMLFEYSPRWVQDRLHIFYAKQKNQG